jgi:hypothetical protein
MLKKTELRDATFQWIKSLAKGNTFSNTDLYKLLERNYATSVRNVAMQRGNQDTGTTHAERFRMPNATN